MNRMPFPLLMGGTKNDGGATVDRGRVLSAENRGDTQEAQGAFSGGGKKSGGKTRGIITIIAK